MYFDTNNDARPRDLVTPGLSRRRVIQGAAWSVPAVLIATAAPAAAASPEQPVGQLTITGDGRRNLEGPPINGIAYRIDNQNLVYSGAEYPQTLVVGIEFPKAYIFEPSLFSQDTPYGWLEPLQLVDAGSVYRLTYTKDPAVSFQNYIPNFGGGTWVKAAAGAPAFTATAVVVSGTTPSGGIITGGGAISFT